MEKAARFCIGGADGDPANTELADLLKPRMQSVFHHCPKLMDGWMDASWMLQSQSSRGVPVQTQVDPSHQHKLPVSTKH